MQAYKIADTGKQWSDPAQTAGHTADSVGAEKMKYALQETIAGIFIGGVYSGIFYCYFFL